MLNSILHTLVGELGIKAASVRLLDAERRTLAPACSVGLSAAYLSKGSVELDKSGVDRAALEGNVVDVPDVRSDARLQYPEAAVREGIGSILVAPLALKDRVIGVLRVYSGHPRKASESEKMFLSAIGKLAARALLNAQRSEAIRNISRQINSSLDMQAVLTSLLHLTVDELNCKGGIIRLLDRTGQHLLLVAATGLSQAYLSKGAVDVGRSSMDQRVLQQETVTIYDVARDEGYQYPQQALEEGIRSVLAVPLTAPDRHVAKGCKAIGVLRVYSSQSHRFGDDEVAFLQFVANLGAIALQNARLYDELNRHVEILQPDEDGWHRVV